MLRFLNSFLERYSSNKDATTAVEFALIAVPFLVMIFGVIEAGRMVWTMSGVQYAMEETSRYASLNSELPNESFQAYAEEKLLDMFLPTASLQISSSTLTSNGINFIEIEADYQISTMLSGILPEGFGNFDYETVARKPIIN